MEKNLIKPDVVEPEGKMRGSFSTKNQGTTKKGGREGGTVLKGIRTAFGCARKERVERSGTLSAKWKKNQR